jgi:hypothetical protein
VLTLLLFPQGLGDATERLLEFLLFRDLDHDGADLNNPSGRVLNRKVVGDPVAGFGSGGQHRTDFEVQHGLPGCKDAPEGRLTYFGKIPQHFAERLSQMRFRRNAVHVGQVAVDGKIAEISIQDAKTHPGRIEISGKERFRFKEGFSRFAASRHYLRHLQKRGGALCIPC